MTDNDVVSRQEFERLQSLVEALQVKINHQAERIEELEVKNEQLTRVIEPDPGTVEYEQLTRAQKVREVRTALIERAAKPMNDGRAAMKYKDVKWLFDGRPSDSHAYDLMERAADLEGFTYDTANHGSGEKRVRVVNGEITDTDLVHIKNQAEDQHGIA